MLKLIGQLEAVTANHAPSPFATSWTSTTCSCMLLLLLLLL
jgi:hypothetical protein